jgi:hypothetical protein
MAALVILSKPASAGLFEIEDSEMKTFAIAAAVLLTYSLPATAKMMNCTSENMAKSVAASNSMPEGPQKAAMMKEMGSANAAMSKGDMRGACKSYMRAQQMGEKKG